MPKNLEVVTKTMSLACPEEKLQIWPSWKAWFFRNIFLPPQKNHEIGKKSKNWVHFILSVFKVVRVKVLSFLLFFAYFILFWGVSKCAHFFSKSFFKTRQKRHENGQKFQKKIFFTKPTFKTVKIKCFRFFHFLPISWKYLIAKTCSFFSKFSITDGVLPPISTDVLGPTKVPTIRYWGKFHF